MKKIFLAVLTATTLFACSTPAENKEGASVAAAASQGTVTKTGPEVELMKKAITAFANADWATMASCFSDSAVSYHNNDTVAMKMSDRIELFKKQRETIDGSVDIGTPNFEVVTLENADPQYKGIKWGHVWVTFKSKQKGGALKSSLTFGSLAIKDGKIIWEQVIYDTK
jgi:hypothetical protein